MATNPTKSFRHYAVMKFGRCQWCDCKLDIDTSTVDHIKARSLGGTNEWKNLILACGRCNRKKGTDDWGQPKFGPFPWVRPSKPKLIRSVRDVRRGAQPKLRSRVISDDHPVNLWPVTLTQSLQIPVGGWAMD